MNYRLLIITTALYLLINCAVAQSDAPTLPALQPAADPEVVILQGVSEAEQFLRAESWWGEINRGDQLESPRILLTSIPQGWQDSSRELPVETKKDFFFRFALPLVLHANQLVRERRSELMALRDFIATGQVLTGEPLAFISELALRLNLLDSDLGNDPDLQRQVIDDLLYRLDEVPAGLALGQAAFESGYGTSRFAVEGNALFGQWTFDGSGMVPQARRDRLGDYGIATFNWPFDSVRAYFLNLSRHPAYEDFRRLRAQARQDGSRLNSLELTAGLINYSERGQEYVDTLNSIIEVNNLTVADRARLREEPIRYLIGTGSAEETADVREQVRQMRESGDLNELIERMELD